MLLNIELGIDSSSWLEGQELYEEVLEHCRQYYKKSHVYRLIVNTVYNNGNREEVTFSYPDIEERRSLQ